MRASKNRPHDSASPWDTGFLELCTLCACECAVTIAWEFLRNFLDRHKCDLRGIHGIRDSLKRNVRDVRLYGASEFV